MRLRSYDFCEALIERLIGQSEFREDLVLRRAAVGRPLQHALHIPADAGEAYSAGLERILRRIPDGWGRWISHERGWYRLIIECDRRLSKVDPNYVVFRVREKFGSLGYYCAPSIEETYEVRKQFQDAIFLAQRGSTNTCERCGRNGVLYQRNDWVKRLCEICGDDLGFSRCQRA